MICIIFFGLTFSESTAKPNIKIPIYSINNIDYIEVDDYATINSGKLIFYNAKKKVELKSPKYNFIFSDNSSFIKINNKIYNIFFI